MSNIIQGINCEEGWNNDNSFANANVSFQNDIAITTINNNTHSWKQILYVTAQVLDDQHLYISNHKQYDAESLTAIAQKYHAIHVDANIDEKLVVVHFNKENDKNDYLRVFCN